MKEDLKQACELFNERRYGEAYLVLKKSRGSTLAEAKELIDAGLKVVHPGDGVTVDQDAAMQQALDAVNTFDELTVMVLRQMRDTKQPIAVAKSEEADALQLCATIYDSMRQLIAHDINPTRAMTTFLTECCQYAVNHKTGQMADLTFNNDYAEAVKCMKNASDVSLRDDLLTLL